MASRYPKKRSDSLDYSKGYADGMRAAYEESELDAYFAGVGYGKAKSGDKNIGFTSDNEREQFEHGISKNAQHFKSYRTNPPSLFERIFGGKKSRQGSVLKTAPQKQQSRRIKGKLKRKHKSK